MPKLSIITVNLNNAKGLEKTITSVIAQTSLDFEYIIIDGNSNDGSIDVIKRYAHRIHYWISELDSGIYNAMNKGIKKAKGEFCQFLNSGDYLLSDTVIEKMLYQMPKCQIYYGNMLKVMSNGRIIKDKGAAGRPITFLNLYRSTINHSTALIKRSLFDKYGLYDETLEIVSDWKFYLIAVGLNDMHIEYKNLDVAMFDMNGVSNTDLNLLQKERRQVLESIIQKNILSDYDSFAKNYYLLSRIKKYKFIELMVRCLNKITVLYEKVKSTLKFKT